MRHTSPNVCSPNVNHSSQLADAVEHDRPADPSHRRQHERGDVQHQADDEGVEVVEERLERDPR